MAKTKILIVDDEKEFSEALSERLNNRGLEAETVSNGSEAVDAVRNKAYDAIVLDLVMPGMDGIETLKMIRQKHPNLQVILLTGHATLEKGVESMKLGALDFLEKPADIDALLAKIGEAKSNRLVLVEKEMEDKIQDIIGKKSW